MTEIAANRLLTEAEVAARMKSTIRKVQRLRRERRLAFIPGRPVLVMESDLEDYLYRQRLAVADIANGPPTAAQSKAAYQRTLDEAANRARRIFRLRQTVAQGKR